jgi:hypothetical protein
MALAERAQVKTAVAASADEKGEAGQRPLCFVISQIGAEKSPERERADKVLRHVIEKALDSKYEIERADEIGKPGLITVQIIQRLASAELVVGDLTGGNPNVYYELALRHMFAKPVVHVIERGEKAPFDVSPMRYVEYDLKDPDVLDAAREELLRQVEAMEKGEKVVTLVQVAKVFAEASEGKANETQAMLAAIYGAVGNLQQGVSNVAAQVVDRLLPPPRWGGAGIGNRSTGVLDGNFAAWMTPGSPETGGHVAVPQAGAVAQVNRVLTMEEQLADIREELKRLKEGTEEQKDDLEKK